MAHRRPDRLRPTAAGAEPGTVPSRVVPCSSDAAFVAMVTHALEAIGRGDLVKVVLARHVDVTLGQTIDVPDLLRRWHDLEPNCTVFSVPSPVGQFVGASPELLVERNGPAVTSRPLAGTAERFIGSAGSVLPGALLESGKDAIEHRLVVDAIAEALDPLCVHLDVPAEPDLVHLHNIVHLGTTPARHPGAGNPAGRCPTRWPWWPPSIPPRRWGAFPPARPER